MVYLLPKSHTLGTQVTCMDALFDPESLRRQSGTTFRDEQSVDSTDDFEYFRSIAGLVAIGIPTEGGQILLMDSPHGWRLPYGPVESGADWAAVARQFGTEMTGKDIAIDTAERIARIERRLENGNEETTSYEAVLRAASGSSAARPARPARSCPASTPPSDPSPCTAPSPRGSRGC